MKNNVVYVDFTRKKIASTKKVLSFDVIKEHIRNLFHLAPSKINNSNGSKQCKRIL
jgi:hypothetical protein